MLHILDESEIEGVSGGTNQEVYGQVDNWMQNNPNQPGQHWEAVYTYDENWNITGVVMVAVSDAVMA